MKKTLVFLVAVVTFVAVLSVTRLAASPMGQTINAEKVANAQDCANANLYEATASCNFD